MLMFYNLILDVSEPKILNQSLLIMRKYQYEGYAEQNEYQMSHGPAFYA